MHWYFENNNITESTFEFSSVRPLNDSVSVQSQTTSVSSVESSFAANNGGGLLTFAQFELYKNLFIRTGIGADRQAFSRLKETINYETFVLSSDTIETIIYPPSPFACNVYINSFTDLESPKPGIDWEIISLSVPFEIGYYLFNEKLRLGAGVLFKTPIHSRLIREGINIHRFMQGDSTACEYVLEQTTDDSGNFLRNARLMWTANANYSIISNFYIGVSYARSMNSVFVDSDDQRSPLSNESYLPSSLNLIVGYAFGKSNTE